MEDLDKLDELIPPEDRERYGPLMQEIKRLLGIALHQAVAAGTPAGIDDLEARILKHIHDSPGLSASDIADDLGEPIGSIELRVGRLAANRKYIKAEHFGPPSVNPFETPERYDSPRYSVTKSGREFLHSIGHVK